MEGISISAQDGQANPPCNPNLKTCTNKKCMLCFENCKDEFSYGKLYEYENIVAHYYCLLLSSNMQQRGEDTEGIFGFLPADIRKEIARGKNLRCCYCKNKGATIGCCSNRCKRVFHLPCGMKNDSLHQFFAEFRSFCGDHRPVLNMKKPEIPQDAACNICLEVFKPKLSNSTVHSLFAFCCKKWFHRICIQKFALNSGYFFKCPMCNNKPLFQRGMQDHGIFIPEQDASWELEPGAYRELLDRHNQCDARPCLSPKGRNLNSPGTRWALILCSSCGSQGMHVRCGNLNFKNPVWECSVCLCAHTRTDEQPDANGGARSMFEGVVEIEDSDDDVQIVSISHGNEDESAIICIDDEEGSPLQLMQSDTKLTTPDGGAISVMTIAASDKIPVVVGDLNVVHQQRMPNPPYPIPHIVSVVGGAQVIDDDEDDVIVESVPSKRPDARTAIEPPPEGAPPPKRAKTGNDCQVDQAPGVPSAPAMPSVSVTPSTLGDSLPRPTSQASSHVGITRQLQNMIIVSPASSALGQQNMSQVQLLTQSQEYGKENQGQMGHISIPVSGMDAAGGVINLQVMFPPGGMINVVQAPFSPNTQQMAQVQTLQFIQGMFPNTSAPTTSQSNPTMSEHAPPQSNTTPPHVIRKPPSLTSIPQQAHATTTASTSQTSAVASKTSPLPSSESTLPAPASPTPVQPVAAAADDDDDDDVQILSEFRPDIGNISMLKRAFYSSLKKQLLPKTADDTMPASDVASVNAAGKQSHHHSSQDLRSQDIASGTNMNAEENSTQVQRETVPLGTTSSPQSTDSGQVSGTSACSPDTNTPRDTSIAEETLGEWSHCRLPATSTAPGPSSSQASNTADQCPTSAGHNRRNRAELIPSFIPINKLQFNHQNDSSLKVIVNKEFVIPVTKDLSCFHNTPNRRRSQNSRYATEIRKQVKSVYRPRTAQHVTARNSHHARSSSNLRGCRLVMKPISDLKVNSSPSKSKSDQDCPESDGKKSQQGYHSEFDLPSSSAECKKPAASGDGQENISPTASCEELNVMLEKMSNEIFVNESAINVNNFSAKRKRRKRKKLYTKLNSYSHKKKKKYH